MMFTRKAYYMFSYFFLRENHAPMVAKIPPNAMVVAIPVSPGF